MNTNSTVKVPTISGSFIQAEKHMTKSNKFQHVTPSDISMVLADHGFELSKLNTGFARLQDRANHQTTIARYIKPTAINGLSAALVFKVPHLYGAVQGFAGMNRLVCLNGLVRFSSIGETYKVRHIGDTQNELNRMVASLVSEHTTLYNEIEQMSNRIMNPTEVAALVQKIAQMRLGDNARNIRYSDLMVVRRQEDQGNDLFTVMNVIQENIMRGSLRYQVETSAGFITNPTATYMRNMVARPVMGRNDLESNRSVGINQDIWSAAAELLKVS